MKKNLPTLLFLLLPALALAAPAPTITGITHASTASLLYTITGTGFAKGAKLLIGGSAPLSTWQGGTTFIVFQPPKGKAGTVDVQVTNPDGGKVVKKGGFTYPSSAIVPVIRGVAPNQNSTTLKTVWGSNFEKGAKVYVNGVLAPAQWQVGTQYIVFQPPQGTPSGTNVVKVSNPSGGSASLSGNLTITTTVAYGYQTPVTGSGGSASGFGIKVVGNTFTDLSGNVLQLQGTNISGLEGFNNAWMDGFANTTVAQWISMKNAWGLNIIRLPVNEYEWRNNTLSAKGVPYQTIVRNTVANITAAGMYAIIDLHWAAPNAYSGNLSGNNAPGFADGQPGYLNSDNSPNFWSSVATTFKNNPAVLFELFNEPYAQYWGPGNWTNSEKQILKDNSAGATYTFYDEESGSNVGTNTGVTFTPAGHQQLVNAIRTTGATNVILWSTTMLDNHPADSLAVRPNDTLSPSQLGATVHYAGGTAGDYTNILNAGYPILMTEMTNLEYIGGYSFAQTNHIGYLMWGPNNWSNNADLSALISTPPWSASWGAGVSGQIPWPLGGISTGGGTGATPTGSFGIKVSGNKFTDLSGNTVQLIGANFSGMENSTNWQPFANLETANDSYGGKFWETLKAYNGTGMNGQHINAIRLQLNSAYWLGYACGQDVNAYRNTVEHVVSTATAAGIYVDLGLFLDMPHNTNGVSDCPHGQGPMPSADHAPEFWKSVADTFKGNPAVLFELFNEPFGSNTGAEWDSNGAGPSDAILAYGGSITPYVYQDNEGGNASMVTAGGSFPVAGEIQLLNTIRNEGATNVVLASTGYWDGDLGQWLNIYNRNGNPDPLKQFGATWHDYVGWSAGSSIPLGILAAGYPLVITETYGFDQNFNTLDGENFTTGGHGLNEAAGYAAARSQGIGYMCGWQVEDWGNYPTISLEDPGKFPNLGYNPSPPWIGCASQ